MMASASAGAAASPLIGNGQANLPRGNWGLFLFRGILGLIVGVLAWLFPLGALFAFTLVFAAYAFADGVASLVSGMRGASNKRDRWGSLILRGLVGIAVGILFIVSPGLSTLSYALVSLALLSVWSIIGGALEIVAAIRLRHEIKGEWLLVLAGFISIALGFAIPVMLFFNPLATLVSVAWVIGIFVFANGAVLIMQALRLRKSGRVSGA